MILDWGWLSKLLGVAMLMYFVLLVSFRQDQIACTHFNESIEEAYVEDLLPQEEMQLRNFPGSNVWDGRDLALFIHYVPYSAFHAEVRGLLIRS